MKPWSPWRDPWFIMLMVIYVLAFILLIAVGAYAVMHIESGVQPDDLHSKDSVCST